MAIYKAEVVTECTETNPYQFYVTGGGLTNQIVNLVMPLGGAESGLYRSPRKGENVLVTDDGAGNNKQYYLMGYLPGTGQAFTVGDKSKVIDSKGEVLRYKKTGYNPVYAPYSGNAVSEEYSEVAFYNKATKWKPGDEDAKYYTAADAKDADGYPLIDRLNIQSTGDIYENAANYHEIGAKRLAILANCVENGTNEKDHGSFDRAGEDSTLYEGDVHIRAKKRIVIKAGESICLEVGRSSINIDDSAVIIRSKNTSGGSTFNYYDSILMVGALFGIFMNSRDIDINGLYNTCIHDSFGGELNMNTGITRLTGKDIMVKSFSNRVYSLKTMSVLVAWVAELASVIANISGTENENAMFNKMPYLAGRVGNPAINFGLKWYFLKHKGEEEREFPLGANESLAKIIDNFNLLRMGIQIVGMAVDSALAASLGLGLLTQPEIEKARDWTALALIIIDLGYILVLGKFICVKFWESELNVGFLHLTGTAQAILEAAETKITSLRHTQAEGPLAGMDTSVVDPH